MALGSPTLDQGAPQLCQIREVNTIDSGNKFREKGIGDLLNHISSYRPRVTTDSKEKIFSMLSLIAAYAGDFGGQVDDFNKGRARGRGGSRGWIHPGQGHYSSLGLLDVKPELLY
eukprot:CAMPEP_0182474518 /NCGR_PEP_ID=MMETSP1319-20130603/25786_1 /TAXON_ID=172717 /ORGANISM="Bolidomonas pacifica, Strain RCC208" /LENGTH=114 /DNA_ID=CAMNT_0024675419 /DNA_START=548 /DNA_END=893 /DNA_ORIENTATION=+